MNRPVRGRITATAWAPRALVIDAADCACRYTQDVSGRIDAVVDGTDLTVAITKADHEPGCDQPAGYYVLSVITLHRPDGPLLPLIMRSDSRGAQTVIGNCAGRRVSNATQIEHITRLAEALDDPHAWTAGEDDALTYLGDWATHTSDPTVYLAPARAGFHGAREWEAWLTEVTAQQALAWRPVTRSSAAAQECIRMDVTPETYAAWMAHTPARLQVPHAAVMAATGQDGWTVEDAAAVWAHFATGKVPHELTACFPATIAFCTRTRHLDRAIVVPALRAGVTEAEIRDGIADGTLTREAAAALAALHP